MIAFLAIMTVDIFYIGFSIFILNFHDGLAVPHEYCLSPLNRSDCGRAATPVLSYYKPGSRCEIEFWRGCPTYNKFNDEFLCSHFCIGKLFGFTASEDKEINKIDTIIEDRCSKPLDRSDCGSKPTTVYTFDGHCKPAEWRGCTSLNIFYNYSSCVSNCEPSFDDWKEQIKSLDPEVVEKLDNLLDDVVETVKEEIKEKPAEIETTTNKRDKLILNITPEPDVEVTKAAQEEVTEAPAAKEVTEASTAKEEVTKAVEEKVTEAAKEEVTEAAKEEVTEAAKEEVTEAAKEEVTEAAKEEVTEATEEKVTEAAKEEVTEAAKEEVTEAAKEEVTEAAKEEVTEAAKEEVTEAVKEEVTEPATETPGAEEKVTEAAETGSDSGEAKEVITT